MNLLRSVSGKRTRGISRGLVFSILFLVSAFLAPGGPAQAQGFWSSCGLDSSSFLSDPQFCAGLVVPNRADGQFHEIQPTETNPFGIQTIRQKYPMRGFYVGALEKVRLSSDAQLLLQGWYMFPDKKQAPTDYRSNGAIDRFTTTWSEKPTGVMLDAALLWSYIPQLKGTSWTQMHGLRVDYYSVKLSGPEQFSAGAPLQLDPGDDVKVVAQAYIPYIGIQTEYNDGVQRGTIRSIASPIVFGSVKHDQTWLAAANPHEDSFLGNFNRGWLIDWWADYGRKISSNSEMGFFLRMGAIDAKGMGNLSTTIAGVSSSANSHLVYRKLTYVLGLSFTASFNLY